MHTRIKLNGSEKKKNSVKQKKKKTDVKETKQ